MWHIGIDLHRRMLVMAAVKDDGEVIDPRRIDCQDEAEILKAVEQLKPFRAVIEATGTYRWLYDLLSPHGSVLLAQLEHYAEHMAVFDEQLDQARQDVPQAEVLLEIYGIGVFSALLIIAELGEVKRFRTAKQVGAYAGLTARVHQSGSHCYYGSITHEGSSWLRWALVQAAMHVIRSDVALRNFHWDKQHEGEEE